MIYYYSTDHDRHNERMEVRNWKYPRFPDSVVATERIGRCIAEQFAEDPELRDEDELTIRLYRSLDRSVSAEWEIRVQVEWDPSYDVTAKKLNPEKPTNRPADKPGQTYMSFLQEEAQ